ncbi:MAG: tripartite tricarboxylate transporter substrate binding protein [Pseudomonadota bacterium]
MFRRTCLKLASVLAAATMAVLPAAAQDAYPDRPITMILPLGAGGSHDINARVVTSILPTYLEQPVVVRLMPGGSGQIGTAAAAESAADGYTLLFSHNFFDQLQHHLVDLPYEPLEDFVTVARLNAAPLTIVVRADAPWQTLEEMLDYGRENPGQLRFGHSGNWGAIMVPGAQLMQQAGVEAAFTPYQGGGPTVQGLLAGDVDFSMMFPAVIEAQGDNLRSLATAAGTRLYDDVPTLQELGYDANVSDMHRVVFAPADIPEDRLAVLRQAFIDLQEDRTFQRMTAQLGEDPSTFMTGEDYEALRPELSEDYRQLIEGFGG